jgi:hypothetical protein
VVRPRAQNVYVDDVTLPLSNSFPGSGARSVVNVCDAGTVVPERLGSGALSDRPCPTPWVRQTVAVDATGGTFKLTFAGQTTASIAFDATPVAVRTALEALSNLAPGDVFVTGGPGGPGSARPYIVRLRPTLPSTPQMTASSGSLSGGAEKATVATVAVTPIVDTRGASLGLPGDRAVTRAASEDGSRVFFMAPDPDVTAGPEEVCAGTDDTTLCPPQLYVRQRDGSSFKTRWIARSEVAGQAASLLAPVTFEGASRDGDKVLLRTATPLTADDPNGGAAPPPDGVVSGTPSASSVDLFLYDFPDDPSADPAAGDLTRITGGPTGAADPNSSTGAPAGVSGAVRFLSDAADRLYFVTAAQVLGVGVPGSGTETVPGGTPGTTSASNLYVYDANRTGSDRWRFVARLPRSSDLGKCATVNSTAGGPLAGTTYNGDEGVVGPDNGTCVRGTRGADFVTFWTDGRLTDEDDDSTSGDMYGYDATSDVLTRLTRPDDDADGGSYDCMPGFASVQCFGDPGYAKSGSPLEPLGVAIDPDAAGDRIAFFQSASRLVAEDTDDAYDVYQWRNGDLSLISVGNSSGDGSFYQGNDRSGETVFFSTLDRFTWQDKDDVMDVYAARLSGGFAEPPAPPDCDPLAGGCQGSGAGEAGSNVESGSPSDGDATPGARVTIAVGNLSARARRRAARTGVIPVPVRASGRGRVTLTATAKVGRRTRRVARAIVVFRQGGKKVARLRLNRSARGLLARGGRLSVLVTARRAGTPTESIRVSLKRKGRR